ncbi:MAG: ABC transporter permease subunit [Actinomycetota bacterium]|nr:ABC transporter permease subunit [Actinomycetota bacterium]
MAALLALAALLVLLPILRLVETLVDEGAGRYGAVLTAPGLGAAVRTTLLLAVVVTVFAVPLGVLTALALRRADLPVRGFWRVAVLLPVLVPEFVLGYSWQQAYGRAGFTDTLMGVPFPGVVGPVGVVVVLVVNAVPIAYLLTAVGLAARAEPDLERAARASGAGSLAVLRTVTLPLLRPALAAASVLVFVLTLASFAVPQVLGAPAGVTTVTTRIYADLSLGADPSSFVEAVTLALLLVLLAVVVVAPADAVLGPRLRSVRVADSGGSPVAVSRGAGGRWAAVGLGSYLLVAVGLPLFALAAASVTRAVGLPPSPDNWTGEHFGQLLDQRTFDAIGRSVGLAVAAASVLTLLGTAVAVLERRRTGRGLGTLVTLTLVLPGSTLAVALLLAYGRWLSGLGLILLAYLAKLWAFAHRPISAALDRLPPGELHAARASGATALTAARTVALRPLAPALAAAWLVCFVTALHEVTMSALLYGPGSETLAVVVLNSQELGRIGPTAALSVLLTGLMAAAAVPLWLAARRLRAVPTPDRERVGVG